MIPMTAFQYFYEFFANIWQGTWPEQLSKVDSYIKDPFLGGTPFDDVFKWGEKYGA